MASTTIILAPLGAVRDAIYERIQNDAATSGYNLATEATPADFPYLIVGPAYKGAGGTDPETVVNVVVQVDAFARTDQGGSNKVNTMITDVATALSRSGITATVQTEGGNQTSDPFSIVVEDDVLNPNLYDTDAGTSYAQRFVRFRLIVTV